MGDKEPKFTDLMRDAHRAAIALDGVTERDHPRLTAAIMENAKRIYSQLLEYQRSARMTRAETSLLQTALDLLRARLGFFGESV